ncbi:hypothetical protein D3C81_2183360 [compost metagenome]
MGRMAGTLEISRPNISEARQTAARVSAFCCEVVSSIEALFSVVMEGCVVPGHCKRPF